MGVAGAAHDTSATPEEVLREAANTGKTPAEIAKAWGVPVPVEAVAPALSPYDTGPKPEEVLREAANTGDSIKATAKKLGAPVPVEAGAPSSAATIESKRTQPKTASAPKAPPGPAATTGAIAHAEKLGVDLAAVVPAGDRITKADVTAHAAVQATTASAGSPTGAVSTANAAAPQANAETSTPTNATEQQVADDRAGKP